MIKKRQIGKLDLYVSEIGLGTAPLGGWPIAVDEQKALETLETAWNNGIRYFDTAPLYGSGMSELRVGNFLKNKKREDFVLSSKVGRVIVDTDQSKAAEKFIGSPNDKDSNFDFSYDGVMKSFEDSLNRLQLDKIDILHLHDPDNHPDHFEQARSGAIKAMIKLKEEGMVTALGCGLNQNEMLIELAKERPPPNNSKSPQGNFLVSSHSKRLLFLLSDGKINKIIAAKMAIPASVSPNRIS